MPRPPNLPGTGWATNPSRRTALTSAQWGTGFVAGEPVTAKDVNDPTGQISDWIVYLQELSPTDGDLLADSIKPYTTGVSPNSAINLASSGAYGVRMYGNLLSAQVQVVTAGPTTEHLWSWGTSGILTISDTVEINYDSVTTGAAHVGFKCGIGADKLRVGYSDRAGDYPIFTYDRSPLLGGWQADLTGTWNLTTYAPIVGFGTTAAGPVDVIARIPLVLPDDPDRGNTDIVWQLVELSAELKVYAGATSVEVAFMARSTTALGTPIDLMSVSHNTTTLTLVTSTNGGVPIDLPTDSAVYYLEIRGNGMTLAADFVGIRRLYYKLRKFAVE